MKKFFLGLIAAIIASTGIFTFAGCEKEKAIAAQNNIAKTLSTPHEFENTYIKVGLGTHLFDNCRYDLPCGPCPGICVRFGFAVYDNIPPVSQGEGIFEVERIYDGKMRIKFLSSGFTNDSQTGLEEDYVLSSEEAAALGFNSAVITILNGIYDVDFSNSTYGETELSLTIHPYTNEQ